MELINAKVNEIKPYPNNPRKNDKAIEPIIESIKQCGYCAPIIVDEDMVVLAGHARLKAIKKLGWEECQICIKKNLSNEQKKKYRLYDNKTNEYAGWDLDMLEAELNKLDFGNLNLDWGIANDESNETKYMNKEYDLDNFGDETFQYECPCCGFRFNDYEL